MTLCYQFIDIQIKDCKSQARPVSWDREIWDGNGNDIKGNPVNPIEFDTTCPFCANLIHFRVQDLYVAENGTINNIECGSCGVSNLRVESEIKVEGKMVEPTVTTFRDPIAAGLFGDEIDFERLKQFDSAEFGKAV
jgi:hypothetical protein